jgi:hypothetical protein
MVFAPGPWILFSVYFLNCFSVTYLEPYTSMINSSRIEARHVQKEFQKADKDRPENGSKTESSTPRLLFRLVETTH